MSDYDITNDFPEFKTKIAELRDKDKAFTHYFTEYDALNRKIIEAEKVINVHGDEEMENLKKKRLELKDQILNVLQKAA